jgi:pimeloyl-ACP methyl ester carboxylesterase
MAEMPHQTWSTFACFKKMRPPVLVLAAFLACASVPASQAQSAQPAPPSLSDLRPTLIVGFVGGFVSHDARAHGEVRFAEHLRAIYPSIVQVKVFENRRVSQARGEILRFVRDTGKRITLPRADAAETTASAPNVILYGHSWGAAAVVSLARKLQQDGVPVLLTIQIDSIAPPGANDGIIPPNVARAANFFQPRGLLHGRAEIRAADSERTQILGNFRFDYDKSPVSCHGYPWWNRVFTRSHMEIECDPKVWSDIEALIRAELQSQASAEAAGASAPSATSFPR